jgi:putative endonuclease
MQIEMSIYRQNRGKRSWKRGKYAESLSAWILRLKGYGILQRRYRSPVGEIDLIATRGNTLVFVEVKARESVEQAAYAISFAQRERLRKSVQHYLMRYPTTQQVRFDAMLVGSRSLPIHLKNILEA